MAHVYNTFTLSSNFETPGSASTVHRSSLAGPLSTQVLVAEEVYNADQGSSPLKMALEY